MSTANRAAKTAAALDLTRFPRRSDLVSAALAIAHLGFVLCPVYLAATVGPSPWLVLLWLWFGLFMHGLINLMHECAHYSAFKPRWASNFVGTWVLGPLVFADFAGYRQRHWDHHRRFGMPDDTKDAYLVDIRGAGSLALFGRSVALAEARKKLGVQRTSAPESASRAWLARTAVVQACFLGSLVAVAAAARPADVVGTLLAAGLAYGFVYAHGLAALTTFVATLRAIAEHQQGADGAERVGRAALRNFTCGPSTRLLFGAYGFAEHATHHREPAVPSYRLGAATAALGADPALAPRHGYFTTLLALARRAPEVA
jgi:fatty acid desaturase